MIGQFVTSLYICDPFTTDKEKTTKSLVTRCSNTSFEVSKQSKQETDKYFTNPVPDDVSFTIFI